MTEHAPFDLVAYRDREFSSVQVKYRSARNGVLDVRLRSTWSDRAGVHTREADPVGIDVVAVYEPSLDRCLWLTPEQIGRSISIRLVAPRNGQRRGVRMATEFLQIEDSLYRRATQRADTGTMPPPTAPAVDMVAVAQSG